MTERKVIESFRKERIYKNQGGLCAYCGRHRNRKYMTVDHIIPLSKGGTNEEENLQCVCKSCNDLKGDFQPEEFTMFIRCILNRSMAIEKTVVKGGVV